MAVQGNLTLNTKVYNPRGRQQDGSMGWALVGDATFGGATSSVLESLRGPSKDGVTRGRFKLSVPKAAAADSPCGCAGEKISEGIFDANVVIPANFTAAERQDFADRAQALIANAIFDAAVGNLEPAW
jgi:hypothetical protein